MKKQITTVLVGLLLATSAFGELWPPLETYVKWSFLIVKCKPEVSDGRVDYKVVEVWKGTNTTNVFHEAQPAGAFWSHAHQKDQNLPEATVFLCTMHNVPSWAKGKPLSPSVSFDVHDGKLVYAPTSEAELRKEYTVPEFKKAVVAAIKKKEKEQKAEQDKSSVRGKPRR